MATIDIDAAKTKINAAINRLISILDDLSIGSIQNKAKQIRTSSTKKKTKPFTNDEYMKTYHLCYTLCVDQGEPKMTEVLYKMHADTFTEYLSKTVLPLLTAIPDENEEELLVNFVKHWNEHKIMNRWMRLVFRYLDRFYIKQENKLDLKNSALFKFKSIIYEKLKDKLIKSILSIITSFRESPNQLNISNDELLMTSIDILLSLSSLSSASSVTLGLTPGNRNVFEANDLLEKDIYTKDFEKELIDSSVEYFGVKVRGWLDNLDIVSFLQKVDKTFEIETKIANQYFNWASNKIYVLRNCITGTGMPINVTQMDKSEMEKNSTLSRLLYELRNTILGKNQKEILSIRTGSSNSSTNTEGVIALLRSFDKSSLNLLFTLFKHVENGLVPISDEFKDFIKEESIELLTNILTTSKSKKTKKIVEVVEIIETFIKLHSKYENLIKVEFDNNSLLARSLKEAFEYILNLKILPKSKIKLNINFCELIATYIDHILKANKLKNNMKDEILNNVIKLFLYIQDKDIFSEIYKKQLSKRLLSMNSSSTTNEKESKESKEGESSGNGGNDFEISKESNMISKFKINQGAQYTSKMEGMIKDLLTNRKYKSKFITFCKQKKYGKKSILNKDSVLLFQNKGIEFDVELLTQGYWPTSVDLKLKYPEEMKNILVTYEEFYTQTSDKKKVLKWVDLLGTCVITTLLNNEEYELTMTTVQASLILLFNSDEASLSFKEIEKTLNLTEDVTKKVLHSFTRMKILLKSGSQNEKKISPDEDYFSVNEKYKNKRKCFKVAMSKIEESHNPKKVTEDRKDAIDAAIVRIMKTRKRYKHNQLIGDVLEQLHLFKPEPKQIKKRIENLIEREYIERDEEDSNEYVYMA